MSMRPEDAVAVMEDESKQIVSRAQKRERLKCMDIERLSKYLPENMRQAMAGALVALFQQHIEKTADSWMNERLRERIHEMIDMGVFDEMAE